MADSATTRNRFRKQEVGAKTNLWGGDWNEDGGSDRLDEALDGVVAFTLSGSKTLSSTNYETDEARCRILNITSGTGGTVTLPSVEKWYLVRNATSGTVTFTAGGATNANVLTGTVGFVMTNGTNCYTMDFSPYLDAAEAAQIAAEAAQTAAELAETHAETAETNAETAETNAAASAVAAAASASAADVSADAAAASAAAASSITGIPDPTALVADAVLIWDDSADAMAYEARTAFQNADADLTAIAGLSASNDDIIQRKAGAWTNRTMAQLVADLPITTGYTQIATSSPTGVTTVDFNSIPSTYADLLLVFTGLSNASGSTMTVALSGDNNSTRCDVLAAFLSGGSDTVYGAYEIPGYRRATGYSFGYFASLTSDTTATSASTSPHCWRISAGINAIRITSAGGNFDAGTVTLYGK